MSNKIITERAIRVGVMNNFNMTPEEHEELFMLFNDENNIFVNSNSYVSINPFYPSIITINPALYFIKPIGDLSNIKAARIKYIIDANPIIENEFNKCVDWCVTKNIPILLTFMRFIKKDSLKMYTYKQDNYKRYGGYFHNIIKENPIPTTNNVYICDAKGKGCRSCNNCTKLAFGRAIPNIYSLNLESSGVCRFNCPDCFAQRLLKMCKNKHPRYNKIYKNRKQLK
jgi:hypothetical protein